MERLIKLNNTSRSKSLIKFIETKEQEEREREKENINLPSIN